MHSAGAVQTIRGPRGLGDSVYLRPIVDHLLRQGRTLKVFSDYPEIFRGVPAEIVPFNRQPRQDIVAHYVGGKDRPDTNQFQDMCHAAGIQEPIRQSFNWEIQNPSLTTDLRSRAAGRKLVLVHGGHTPMDRTDRFGAELLPEKAAFDLVLASVAPGAFLVRIGKVCKMPAGYPLAIDFDLRDKTSVSDLLDISATCDSWIGQCSSAIPLAEAFGKPLLVVWARRGLTAPHGYVRSITPEKVLAGPLSRFVFDDWQPERMRAAALELLGKLR